jgi:hypothetical protein
VSNTDQPRVYLTRPLKLNLKGTKGFGQSVEDAIKNSNLRDGDFLLWFDGMVFELDNCLHLSICQNVASDMLDITSMGAFEQGFLAVPSQNEWTLVFTLNQGYRTLLAQSRIHRDVCTELYDCFIARTVSGFQLYDFAHKTLYKSEAFFTQCEVYPDPVTLDNRYMFQVEGTAPLEMTVSQ